MHQNSKPFPVPVDVLHPVLHFTEMVLPPLSNHYGTLFAGQALALMSKAAFVAANRRAGHDVVMAAAARSIFSLRYRKAARWSCRPKWCALAAHR